jgi:membrane protease subunit HflK
MPWNNQGGGGPWGGGGGGGGGNNPWGRPPGGFGPKPPDIEELLKRGQERVKNVLPGGFGTGKGIVLVGLVVLALWAASGFYRVEPDEQGVVLRFGEWVRTTQPGLNYRLPSPIETVLKPKVTRVNSLDIGFRASNDPRSGRPRSVPEEGLMLTGDENIIDIQYTVLWQIKDAGLFLFNIASPEATVKAAAESAMREVAGQMTAGLAFAEGRRRIEDQSQRLLQQILDEYGSGILVTQIQLRGVEPPAQVIDAFRDVQRAKADRERVRNEADSYRNDIVPRARGEAQRMIQEAEGYRQRTVAEAEGEAQRFLSVYNAYRLASDVTRQRLYLETMELILRGSNKVIMDKGQEGGGTGVIPYLPLPEVRRNPPAVTPAPGQPGQPGQATQGGR